MAVSLWGWAGGTRPPMHPPSPGSGTPQWPPAALGTTSARHHHRPSSGHPSGPSTPTGDASCPGPLQREQPGCGSTSGWVVASVQAQQRCKPPGQTPLSTSTSSTPPQPHESTSAALAPLWGLGVAVGQSVLWTCPRCMRPGAAWVPETLTHKRAIDDANSDGHQGPALGADLGRAAGRAWRVRLLPHAPAPRSRPPIPARAVNTPGNLQHVRTSS